MTFFMNKSSIKCSINQSGCCRLLQKLNSIESKCDRIILELSEVKNLVSSKPSVEKLLESLEQSANDLYEQSVRQREFVERSMAGEVTMRIVRRNEYGL